LVRVRVGEEGGHLLAARGVVPLEVVEELGAGHEAHEAVAREVDDHLVRVRVRVRLRVGVRGRVRVRARVRGRVRVGVRVGVRVRVSRIAVKRLL
jgi:hypothetical protein